MSASAQTLTTDSDNALEQVRTTLLDFSDLALSIVYGLLHVSLIK